MFSIFEQKNKKYEENQMSKELVEKSKFISERFLKMTQIFTTSIYFYHQVIQDKVESIKLENEKNLSEIKNKMENLLEKLKSKKTTKFVIQEIYFKQSQEFDRDLSGFTNRETSKEKIKNTRDLKFVAEENYNREYVNLKA